MSPRTTNTPDDLDLDPTQRTPTDEGDEYVLNRATQNTSDASVAADTTDSIVESASLKPNSTLHNGSDRIADQAPPETPRSQVGLLVNDELEQALKECQEKVRRIAKECRMKNTKFR